MQNSRGLVSKAPAHPTVHTPSHLFVQPRSAWNVFMERHRAAVVARMPVDVAQADLLKALSEEYRNLDVETREVSVAFPTVWFVGMPD